MALRVQSVQVGTQPGPRPLDGNLPDWNSVASNLHYRAPSQIDIDGFDHATATENRRRPASAKKSLVDVVMQNSSKMAQIFTAKIPRERLRERVTDCIWMAQAFALDDFHDF